MGADTTVQDDESRLIQQMDAGPASVRNRFTAITQTIKTTMILTGAELETFLTFFRTTLSHGQDPFTWTHPVDGSSIDMRFKTKPEWGLVKPDPVAANRIWSASFELETMPE
jgi:hypothetical protein